MLQRIAIQPVHQFLPRVNDDGTGHGNAAEPIDSPGVQLQRGLITKFLEDVLLDRVKGALSVNEMVVENLLQRLKRFPGLLFESLVPATSQSFVVIGWAILAQVTDSGPADLFVMNQ